MGPHLANSIWKRQPEILARVIAREITRASPLFCWWLWTQLCLSTNIPCLSLLSLGWIGIRPHIFVRIFALVFNSYQLTLLYAPNTGYIAPIPIFWICWYKYSSTHVNTLIFWTTAHGTSLAATEAQQELGSLCRKEKPDLDDPTAKKATTPGLRVTCGQLSRDSVQCSLTVVTYQPTGCTAQWWHRPQLLVSSLGTCSIGSWEELNWVRPHFVLPPQILFAYKYGGST